MRPESGRETLYDHEDEDAFIDGEVVGEIIHLFNGFS